MKLSEKIYIPLLAVLGFVIFQIFMFFHTSNSFANFYGVYHLLLIPVPFVLFFVLQKYNTTVIYTVIIFYQFIFVTMLYLYYVYGYSEPLGYRPIDALFYHNVATYTSENVGWLDIFGYLLDNYSVGELGFLSILHFIYKIPGSNPIFIAKLFNIIFHLITSVYTYRLALIVFKSKKVAIISLLLVGLNPSSILYNASGLKEPVFALVTIVPFYYLYKAYDIKSLPYFILGIILAMVTGFFRVAFPVFIVGAFSIFYFLNTSGKYKLVKQFSIIVVGLVGLFISYKLVETELSNKINYDIIAIATHRLGGSINYLDYIIMAISSVIGPFPAITYTESSTRLILQTPGIYFKIILTLYFVVGVLLVFQDRVRRSYPLILFFVFNAIVLTGLAATLDYRFIYPHVSLIFILLSYGYVKRSKLKAGFLIIELPYFIMIVTLIVLYNFR